MKVFLATLFFVGFAAAVPCPVLEKLKRNLQHDVKVLRIITDKMIESKGPSVEEAIATFVQNPSTGSDALKELLTDVAKTAFYNGTYNFLQTDRDIKIAVSGLEKVDPKLVKDGVYPLLDNLRQQMIHDLLIDRGTVLQLLEEARQLFEVDAKILKSDPAEAPKIQEKRIGDWLRFVDQRKEYVKKTDQIVQDTLRAIEKLYQ